MSWNSLLRGCRYVKKSGFLYPNHNPRKMLLDLANLWKAKKKMKKKEKKKQKKFSSSIACKLHVFVWYNHKLWHVKKTRGQIYETMDQETYEKSVIFENYKHPQVHSNIVFFPLIPFLPATWWELIHNKIYWPNAVLWRPEKGYPISIDLETNVDFRLLFLSWSTSEESITSKMLFVEQSILDVFNCIRVALAPCNRIFDKIQNARL